MRSVARQQMAGQHDRPDEPEEVSATPESGRPAPEPGPGPDQPGVPGDRLLSSGYPGSSPQGLSWSWELDVETLQAVLNEPAPWNRPIRRPAPPDPVDPADSSRPTDPSAPSRPADPPDLSRAADPVDSSRPAEPDSSATPPASPDAGLDLAAALAGGAEEDQEAIQEALLEAIEAGRTREVPIEEV